MTAISKIIPSVEKRMAIDLAQKKAKEALVKMSARNEAELAEGLKSVNAEFVAAYFNPKVVKS